MFNRIDNLFIITVNNLKALESVSEWIYNKLKSTYLIQVEVFPNLTIYRICIPMRNDWDKKVERDITKYLELRNTRFMEEEA